MKKAFAPALLLILLASAPVRLSAQQIPYLPETFSRYEEFNRLYNEKRRAGASLSAIEPLRPRAEEAFKRYNIPLILELLGEGIALLKGKPWDEKEKFLSSLTLDTNCLVVGPNQDLQVTLERMFPSNVAKAFSNPPTVSFEVVPAAATAGQVIDSAAQQSRPVVIAERLTIAETISTSNRRLQLPDGVYRVVARIEVAGQKVAEITQPLYAISDFKERLIDMAALVEEIKKASNLRVKAFSALVTTPEFQLQRLAPLNATRGDDDINPLEELDRIEAYLTALAKGQNPFSNERGELERAYRASDNQLVPYRVYVPKGYDGSSAKPLLVMLHGATGDESSYLSDLYDSSVIKGEAERRGYILAAPNGRGRFSLYTGAGGEDVIQVIEAATRDYEIDESRIYLTGHSMGGSGTWSVAAARPDLFAAIAPVSAAAPDQAEARAALVEKLKAMPVFVVHGARDSIIPPERSRAMVEAAKKAGLKVTYLEAPDADHFNIVAATFPALLDFFDKHSKAAPEK